MFNFILDPPSGLSNSYFDIKFVLEFDRSDEVVVKFFNLQKKEQIEILSVSTGRIDYENTVHAKNCSKIEGYINLFNKDKMNNELENFSKIIIQCEIEQKYQTKEPIKASATAEFYNESLSLDHQILPFDLRIPTNVIDISKRMNMQLDFSTSDTRKYEISIRSADQKFECIFDVLLNKGRHTVKIPSEILWHDLQLKQSAGQLFHLYWVKFEGVNFMNFRNRKYIKIPNMEIKFIANDFPLKPLKRISPTGALTDDFILSDRYFVWTHKKFSNFGNRDKIHNTEKMSLFTRTFHEQQYLQKINSQMKSMENKPIEKQTMQNKTVLRNTKSSNLNPKQRIFMESFASSISRKHVSSFSSQNKTYEKPAKKENGCGCARGKK